MRQSITGCSVCGWRFPQPLEIELPGYQFVELRHLEGQEPHHILLCPAEIGRAQAERLRAMMQQALAAGEG